MRLRDAALLALSTLQAAAWRTLLTVLGLGVGVAAVLTVQSLGRAGESEVEKEIIRLGVNKVWITAEDGSIGEEAAQLVRDAAGAQVCAGAAAADVVGLDGVQARAAIAGYDGQMLQVHGGQIIAGRAINAQDHVQARAVCLIDTELEALLGGDALGRRVSVLGRRLLVVGVVEGMAMPGMAVGGGLMVMPLSTWQDTTGTGVQQLTLSVPGGQSAQQIADAALHALGAGLRADTLQSEIDAARQIVRIFVMVLTCVAAVCMVTGGIGVMNVLLVGVRERRREIGLLKALGARASQVGLIFLLEAAGYALLGGLLGTALGAVMIRLLGGVIGLSATLRAGDALGTVAAASLLGAAFGVAPAMRASGMQVVDALRSG